MSDVVVTDQGRQGYGTVETMVPNLTREPLANLKVRQAIARAMDKDYIVAKVFFGQSVVATGPVSRLLNWAYNPNVVKYERDVELANRLLDEAGYPRGSDGIRFRLNIVYASGWAKVVEALRDELNEVGIALDMELMEFNAMVDRIYIKKDFDLGFSSFENGPDPDIGVKRTVVSTNIGQIPFSNGAGYRNPRIDELFDLASSETNKQKRAEYYFEAQNILVKDLAYFWLYEPRSSATYDAALQGVYQWSAKSNLHFASDAWWSDVRRADKHIAGSGNRRWVYALVGILIAALAIAVFAYSRRDRNP
jgi:peptide/nickel transport system substrate-binding protein